MPGNSLGKPVVGSVAATTSLAKGRLRLLHLTRSHWRWASHGMSEVGRSVVRGKWDIAIPAGKESLRREEDERKRKRAAKSFILGRMAFTTAGAPSSLSHPNRVNIQPLGHSLFKSHHSIEPSSIEGFWVTLNEVTGAILTNAVE